MLELSQTQDDEAQQRVLVLQKYVLSTEVLLQVCTLEMEQEVSVSAPLCRRACVRVRTCPHLNFRRKAPCPVAAPPQGILQPSTGIRNTHQQTYFLTTHAALRHGFLKLKGPVL